MEKRIYYLVGFMASGKSTVGPILANTIGWDFYDLDKEIEKKEGMKVTAIFKEKGEEYFRNLETELLKRISEGECLIISLGGGTLLKEENRKFIKSRGKMIYLKASPEAAYYRLRFKKDRPVLFSGDSDEPTKDEYIRKIKELLEEREKYYLQADYIIDTEHESVGKTVDRIARIIEKAS